MSSDLARRDNAEMVERVIMQGDLAALSPEHRLAYYQQVCESVGLNPLTRPFDYLKLNGKLVLYAKKDATDQLRNKHRISVQIMSRQFKEGLYVVTARATTPDGRYDEEDGVVSVRGQSGENLANAMLKAVTKAKRRVTLSVCGLGWLDETEVETIPMAQRIAVAESGEIVGANEDQAAVERGFPPTPPTDEEPHAVEVERRYSEPADTDGRWGNPPPTERQQAALFALAKKTGTDVPRGLTRQGASELIGRLSNLANGSAA